MSNGWQRYQPKESEFKGDKPSLRWELSPELGIDTFNLNVAMLDPARLSQNHFHYHGNRYESIHVAEGRCRVEVLDDRFIVEQEETVWFVAGESGTHLVHNPFDEVPQITTNTKITLINLFEKVNADSHDQRMFEDVEIDSAKFFGEESIPELVASAAERLTNAGNTGR